MAKFEDEDFGETEELQVVEDEEGNKFVIEMIIPVNGKQFAILVPFEDEEDACGCGSPSCDECGDDADAFIMRIDIDENGEEIYVEPTDAEFEEVVKVYEEILEEEEGE